MGKDQRQENDDLPPGEEKRQQVINAARQFYRSEQKEEIFQPGISPVPVTQKSLDFDDLANLLHASMDLWLTAGRFHRDFESQFSTHMGRRSPALLANSGSSANLLAFSSLFSPRLKNFDLRPLKSGDEVITLAAGFPTTVNPIIQNGCTPVFIDVDPLTLNALPEKVMEAKTPRTRAVVLAHTLGNPFRADVLEKWCKENDLFLIEDCCDALGAEIEVEGNLRPVGGFGDFATTSFYPAHHITMGEGGAIVARNAHFRKICLSFRDWGRDCWCDPGKDNTCGQRFDWQLGSLPEGYDHKYIYSHVGYNLKVTDMQAAIGLSQLKKLPNFIEARRRNWDLLQKGIVSSPVLKQHLRYIHPTPHTRPSWFGFPLFVSEAIDRKILIRHLENAKIATRLLFAGNMTKQPAYAEKKFRIHGELSETDRVMEKLFWIGVHPSLKEPQINYMLECLENGIERQLTSKS